MPQIRKVSTRRTTGGAPGDRDGDGDGERGGKRKKGDKGDRYEVTEEELEAYRMNRRMMEDPMANYVDDEDGV